jgi:hypothetical protein
MATKMHIDDRFACTPKTFLQMILSEEYDHEMLKYIKMKKEILEKSNQPHGMREKVKMISERDLPGFMKKIIGAANYYIETRDWNFETFTNNWFETPGYAAGKADIKGTFKIVAEGESACRRVVDGVFTISIPLLGKKIEEYVVGETQESFRRVTEFARKWISEKGLSGK